MISSILRRRALPFLFVALCLPLAALRAQPVITLTSSGYSVELGGTVLVDGVRANGQAPMTYQWVEQGANNTTVVLHDGATANGSTLSGTSGTAGVSGTGTFYLSGMMITGATAADAGAYAVQITDANGGSATSAWITLTVNPASAPRITSQPGNVTVTAGNNASFFVAATGSYPRTYQWYKGTPGSGVAISGATSNPYTITGALAGDAGSYYATVSNAYGSDTSAAATLTVNPATPITYSGSGSSQTAYVGQSVSLYMYPSGSSPITYQWQKNGVPISGATNYSYTINPVALSDAGTYTQVATNAAGSVTSPAITLTVNPAVPVTFSSNPTPVTITSGQSLNLYMSASGGSAPITYQWQKDGVSLSGSTGTNYYKSVTTTADSGSYTVIGTNPAGSTTSPAIQVTVNPPTPPTITTAPANQSVAQGNYVSFGVSVGGSPPYAYQWLKNGTAISGATSSSFSINSVQPADAASYSVTVTNAAGSVTSPAATLTVLPPVPPSFSGTVSQQSVNVGANLTLSVPYSNSNGAVGPYTYQWYKNGSAISGGTGNNYSITSAQLSDAGTYAVTVTNAGGTVAAPPIEVAVTPATPTGTAWIAAAQQGSVVYFLFASHIERYDLSSGSWLPGTNVSQTATAFCVAPDGVYVGFGRAITKFPLDLSAQTTLANLGSSVTSMFSLGNFVYALTGSSAYPINRSSGAVGAAQYVDADAPSAFAVAAAANRIYTPNGTWGPNFITADASGSLSDPTNTTYYGTFRRGTLAYLLPDQQHFADNGGTVFNVSNGKVSATFGSAFTDMAFLADGTPVVLRNNILYTYAVGGMKETAHTALSVTGSRVFVSGGNVLVFYPGTSSGNSYVGLTQVAASSISSPYPTAPAADAAGLSFTAGATLQDNAGVMYLYDAAHENLFRWSPSTRAYLAPIPLTGAPTQFMYSGTVNSIYCVYRSSRVTRIDLNASSPAEQPFSAFPDAVNTAVGADNYLFAILQDAQSSGEDETLIDARTGAITAFDDRGVYYAASYTWSSANQTLYPNPGSYGTSGSIQPVTSSGTFGPTTLHFSQGASGAIFASADGTRLVAAGGQVYDATGLYFGVLGNAVTKVAFLGNTPYTMRTGASGTEIQSWSPTSFLLSGSATLPGTPVNIGSLAGNQLLVVTQSGGAPTFTILNAALQRVSTTAGGSSSGAPTFVSQPAASLGVFAGTAATLAVDTNGATPQTFQWYKNGTAIGGATSSTLSLSSVSSGDAANYYVIATNSAGSATSSTTTLSVYPALAFTTQPQSQVATSGSVTFTAGVANDTGASYQWYFNGTALSGATSNTLVVSPVGSSNWGTYVLKVSNTAGAIYSNVASLLPPPPVITAQPLSTAIMAGGYLYLYVSAQYANTYQWYLNGQPIDYATYSSYSVSTASSANAGTYTVVVTGQGGSTTSAAATVTVGAAPPPTITTQPVGMRVDPATNVTLSVVGTNVTSYQWYFNGTAIAGATNASLVIYGSTSANSGNYTVTLTGPGGSITSAPATLTVAYLPPVITQQPQSIIAPAGSNVQFLASGSNIHALQWYFNGAAISGAVDPWLNLTNITNANVGSYYLVLTGPGGDTVKTNTVTLSLGASQPPIITTQPQSTTAAAGTTVTLSVTATNVTSYQWYHDGVAITGATNATLVLGNVTASSAGSYTVAVTGPGGSLTSSPATLTVATNQLAGTYFGTIDGGGRWAMWVPVAGNAKFIAYLPANNGAVVGELNVAADGTLSLRNLSGYSKIGSAVTLPTSVTGQISGGQVGGNINNAGGNFTGSIDRGTAMPALAGYYPSLALNGAYGQSYAVVGGTGQTLIVWVNFQGIGTQPDSAYGTLTGDPEFSGTSALGRSVTVSLDANSGALSETLAGSNNASVAFGGVATNSSNPGRLLNLSSRADVGVGGNVLISGFSIAGAGSKGILVRAVGPTLKNYGLPDALTAPKVTFNDGNGTALWSGTSWGGTSSLISTFDAVGAFPLDPTSADAAHTFITAEGRYTATVASADTGTGVALAEVYDTDGAPTAARLVNLSARANVESGAGVLTAGLVVGGNGPVTVLLRGIGPALKNYGITNYLAAPQLTLFDGDSKQIAANAGWTDDNGGMTSYTMNKVSAFALTPGSADCVIIATLMPGRYTVQVSSQDPTQTGVALVEVYEVP